MYNITCDHINSNEHKSKLTSEMRLTHLLDDRPTSLFGEGGRKVSSFGYSIVIEMNLTNQTNMKKSAYGLSSII